MTTPKSHYSTITLLYLFLLCVACAPDAPSSEISEAANTPAAEQVENEMVGIDTTPSSPAGSKEEKSATVKEKIPAWREKSPFKNLVTCKNWEKSELISAACCKKVTALYAGLKANPGSVDIAMVEVQDPFLSSCREFNSEFKKLIEDIMYPAPPDTLVDKVPF